MKMKSFVLLLVILLSIKFTKSARMVYEFGVDYGDIIYSKDGAIPLLTYDTNIDIPIPDDVMITYIKVTVDSLSPPKVDYEALFKQVSIKYTWIQVTASAYNIVVKGELQKKTK